MSEHHNANVENQSGRKTLSGYIVGLVLSLLLTLAAFTLVGKHLLPETALFVTIIALALVQLFVQVVCFLRLNASPEGRWDLMPFLFTILIVLVLVFGSIWIMFSLNYNMMH